MPTNAMHRNCESMVSRRRPVGMREAAAAVLTPCRERADRLSVCPFVVRELPWEGRWPRPTTSCGPPAAGGGGGGQRCPPSREEEEVAARWISQVGKSGSVDFGRGVQSYVFCKIPNKFIILTQPFPLSNVTPYLPSHHRPQDLQDAPSSVREGTPRCRAQARRRVRPPLQARDLARPVRPRQAP